MKKTAQPIASRQECDREDEDNLVAAAKRNPLAFAALYDRYVNPIYRYLLSHVGNPTEALDLTSHVFLNALEGLLNYEHRGHFAAWLFAIARHKTMDYFRQDHHELPLETAIDLPIEQDPQSETIGWEEIRDIRRLIYSLPEDEQELVRLRFVARLTFSEMAANLGCGEEAAKKRLYRLLARLENQMEARNG